MTSTTTHESGVADKVLRLTFWSFAALLLLAPLIAMTFTDEVRWDGADFVFAGVLIGIVCVAFELTMRRSPNWTYRFAVGCAVAAAFMIVWANAAVGMIADGDNLYNLLFLAVIILALAGAVVARFRARGMAATMGIAAVAHLAIAGAGATVDPRGALFSSLLAVGWLLSASLFRRAAR